MATSTLPPLWTSPAFAFETLMKKRFKDHTPSLQRGLGVASTILAEEKFKMCIGFLVRSIISKNAVNSHYFWPCCLVSWGKSRKWMCLLSAFLQRGNCSYLTLPLHSKEHPHSRYLPVHSWSSHTVAGLSPSKPLSACSNVFILMLSHRSVLRTNISMDALRYLMNESYLKSKNYRLYWHKN